jgi:tetratricopeptide (TPR) repeat protein
MTRLAATSRASLLLAALLAPGAGRAAAEEGIVIRPLGGVRPEAAALLARGGESGGPLRLQGVALALGTATPAAPVLVAIELDGATLLANHPGGVLGIELAVYAADAAGRIAATRTEGIAVDLSRWADAAAAGGVRWVGSFDLAPGDWSFRIFARVRQTGAFGIRQTRCVVPAAAARRLDVVAPGDAGWIEARSPGLSPAVAAALETLGGPPAALPVVPAEAPASWWAIGSGGGAGPLTARLADGLGRPAGEPAVAPGETRSLAPGVEALAIEIAPPRGNPGWRDLVVARDGVETSPRRLIVQPGADAGTWAELARVAVGTRPEDRLRRTVAPPASKKEKARFRAAYREAWQRYGKGDREGGVAALQTFEADALAADRRNAMGWLDHADRELVAHAIERRPGAALPLALFYRDLFRAHLGAGRLGLARRAETRAGDLLVRFAERAASPEDRAIAAAALDALAAELLTISAPQRAIKLLERSTALVSDRAETWLALAALRERDRDFHEAIVALDKALAAAPRHREARLRLARVALLSGSAKRGIALLDALASEPVADWVGVVAVQERVRLRLAENDVAGARVLLERAVERWPREPSLALALAYAYERSGRRGDARNAASRAVQVGATFSHSPRKLYSEPPTAALAAGSAAIEAAVMLRLDELATAVEGLT